ncbi:MAG: hypothetical protein DRP01_09345 [Archaeoglobales archaeon]|nr:MAG: hypothetical protein DRP01_09345 [Archaeoglobales archaeon]
MAVAPSLGGVDWRRLRENIISTYNIPEELLDKAAFALILIAIQQKPPEVGVTEMLKQIASILDLGAALVAPFIPQQKSKQPCKTCKKTKKRR